MANHKQSGRGPGRPKLGDCRLECVIPKAVMDELMKIEVTTGQYRTRVAARILERELILKAGRRPLKSPDPSW